MYFWKAGMWAVSVKQDTSKWLRGLLPVPDYSRYDYDADTLVRIYRALLVPRLIEERMLLALRKGQISKWFSAWGQEAISVGVALAAERDEWLLTMHRNLGVFTTRGVPLAPLFKQLLGKAGGFTEGRERSFHFGLKDYCIYGMISHVGANLPVADGIALACKLSAEKKATVAFCGEGATSEGDFHEAVNVASVWRLPVLFVIENNQWAISTPVEQQFRVERLSGRAQAYAIEGTTIDGNNVLEVYTVASELLGKIRQTPDCYLLECITFRMRGHEEASETSYMPQEAVELWWKRDPITTYREYLLAKKVLTEKEEARIREELNHQVEQALTEALAAPEPIASASELRARVYAPANQKYPEEHSGTTRELRMVDAISEALAQAMERYPNLVLMGQDIAEHGGVFKVTKGLVERFGAERVRNTPLCESAIVGVAVGLSVKGFKSVVEMQFADFVSCAFNQVVNQAAKLHWRWGQVADLVMRMPTGAGVGAGPFHSQSTEGWFMHVPGLKIVYPSTAYDAKGLLLAAIEDPNPVLYYEHKYLYRRVRDPVPEHYYTVEIGKARVVREGTDLTIITYGWGVHEVMRVLEELPEVSAEVIDMRTLLPWDKETVAESVKKTGKVLVVYEDTFTLGVGAEWAAWIAQELFEWLDAPVMRVASLDCPVPFALSLEREFLPWGGLSRAIEQLWRW